MTVRRSPSVRSESPSEPRDEGLLSTRSLLLLAIAGACTWTAAVKPIWGAAILVGAGVLTLLHTITRRD
jgi:hypothetical protein